MKIADKTEIFLGDCKKDESDVNSDLNTLENLVDDGYTEDDGTPLKCYECDSENLESYGHIYDEHGVVEYYMRCKEHKHSTGLWAYGSWEM